VPLRPGPSLASVVALLLVAAAFVVGPPAPSVAGPRQTNSRSPTFIFSSKGAARYVCAFDSRRLHACPARYKQPLALGRHVLRVRAVSRAGRQSRLVTVVVDVLARLDLAATVPVGAGPGVPGVGAGQVWVPNTRDGTLSGIATATNSAAPPIRIGAPDPPDAHGFLDSAVVFDGSVWVARDFAAEIVRVDPSSGAVKARIVVARRPGGLTTGGGFVWAFHFLDGTVTRVDPRTNGVSTFSVAGAASTGITYAEGAVWLLTVQPTRVLKLDPATGAVLARVRISPPTAPKHAFIAAWWLVAGEGSLWLTNPNYDMVTRIDPATAKAVYVGVPVSRPFSVAAGVGAVWAVGERSVARIDPATNRAVGLGALPAADSTGFMQVVQDGDGVWITNFDKGAAYRVRS
jgi:streptogramin lyase